jgi:hypothetical protein
MSIKKGVILIWMAVVLTACYPISNVEKNLVPPLEGVHSEVLRQLIEDKYPEFVYHTPTKKTEDDPLIEVEDFYMGVNLSYVLIHEQDQGPMHLLLVQGDDKPVILFDVACFTKEIQRIEWADVSGDTGKELMVSYISEGKSNGLFEVYTFGDTAEKIYTGSFNHWVYGTLESGKTPYLYAVVETLTQEGIRLYDLEEKDPQKQFETRDSVHLDLNYGATDLQIGQVNEFQRGVFVDGGVGAHSSVTDIVMRSEGKLKSATQNPEGINETTFKPYYAAAKDIDSDGIIEVPFMSPAIGDENLAMYETSWVYSWKALTKDGVWHTKATTLDTYGLGSFQFPEDWLPYLGVETVYQSDNSTDTTLLYDNGEIREPMITFYLIPAERFDEKLYPEAIIIEKKPLYIILFTLHKGNQNRMMQLTPEEISKSFKPEPWLNE